MENAGKRWSGQFLFFFSIMPLGCDKVRPSACETPVHCVTNLAAEFDATAAAKLQGRVTWTGEIPVVSPFTTRPHPLAGIGLRERQVRDNPNAPHIEPLSRGVANAVVYLRGVDPKRSRPWDLPPVRLEMQDRSLVVCQGDRKGNVGIVRRGEAVTMVSTDQFFHALHADGAGYFSLMFPEAEQPLQRTLDRAGLIEWSSACGYYWLRGYTFVDDHPYYAVTDAQGRFTLAQVPPGRYEAVCWLPNWKEGRRERDPDMAIVWRLGFQPPLERVRNVVVQEGQTNSVDFVLSVEGTR